MEEKIIKLENDHIFLERTVEQLNEALCRQQQEIDLLTKRVEKLEQQQLNGIDGLVDKRPPHY